MTLLTSLNTTFNFIDRQSEQTVMCLSGWSFPVSVFDIPDHVNVIEVVHYNPTSFETEFCHILDALNIEKVSIYGFSLGGYVALYCLVNYFNRVEHVYFYGCRPFYPKIEIDAMLNNLLTNQIATVKYFWKNCFYDKALYKRFFTQFGEKTLALYSLEELKNGLSYLAKQNVFNLVSLHPEIISNITFYHGECDEIAPFKEFSQFIKNIEGIQFQIISKKGHFTF